MADDTKPTLAIVDIPPEDGPERDAAIDAFIRALGGNPDGETATDG